MRTAGGRTLHGMGITRVGLGGDVRQPLLFGLGTAALWAVLAVARPGFTFHFGPLLVGATSAIMAGTDDESARTIGVLALIGGTVALAVTALLAALGRMEGPSLLPTGGAVLESVVFAVGGAVAGFALGLAAKRLASE